MPSTGTEPVSLKAGMFFGNILFTAGRRSPILSASGVPWVSKVSQK